MQVVADRLSLRWYLGYDLTEPLPDHSSLSRIRERYGLDVFRRFFEAIVEQCIAAGLVWGKELYFDATKVEANASLDSVAPRFAVEAHLGALRRGGGSGGRRAEEGADGEGPTPLPVELTAEAQAALAEVAASRHDWIGEAGRPDRTVIRGDYRRDGGLPRQRHRPRCLADALPRRRSGPGLPRPLRRRWGKARIVLAPLVTPAEVRRLRIWTSCLGGQFAGLSMLRRHDHEAAPTEKPPRGSPRAGAPRCRAASRRRHQDDACPAPRRELRPNSR